LERQIIGLVSQVLARFNTRGKITAPTRAVYTMALLGTINYIYTWYDPQDGVKPKQYAHVATDLFLNGFLAASEVAPDRSVVPCVGASPGAHNRRPAVSAYIHIATSSSMISVAPPPMVSVQQRISDAQIGSAPVAHFSEVAKSLE
jgi:Tetracyclin repressor-like, C-terminal domain